MVTTMIASMKFLSVISAIRSARRPAACAALAACLLGSNACVSLTASKHTYSASSPAVRVNGADIRMQVKPEGTSGGSYAVSAMVVSATVATFDGPFRWRLEALGKAGEHQSLVVHRIFTRTSKSHRDELYPSANLGSYAAFKPVDNDAVRTRAVYPIPGLLVVKPRDDGNLEVTVDLTVIARGQRVRQVVRFRMDPSQKRQDEFIFVPTEIVNSIGKSPATWDESGWD